MLENMQLISMFFGIIGVFYAGKQISLLTKTHAKDHDWNRRKAAQDATIALNRELSEISEVIEEYKILDNYAESAKLDKILSDIENVPDTRIKINRLLNAYDAIARGVWQSVYDEDIIRLSREVSMTSVYTIFKPFIMYRRNEQQTKYNNNEKTIVAWNFLEKLVKKWETDSENLSLREHTGDLSQ